MIRPRLLTAAALLLAPCLMAGCDDNEPEPSVGGVDPTMTVEGDGAVAPVVPAGGEADPGVERPSEELDDEDNI